MTPSPTPSTAHTLPGWQRIRTQGIDMAASVVPPRDAAKPTVVLLHGFPELAFSWRHQIRALTDAGYGVLAPDLRGYGDTGPQGTFESYRMQNLALDVTGLLDALGHARAVIVGHDFGGALAWTLARDHADRVLGIASLNTPYTRRTEADLVHTMRQARGPTHYMVTFQQPGVGEALLGANVTATFRGLMRRPAVTLDRFAHLCARVRALPATVFTGEPELMGAPLLEEPELQLLARTYERTGFEGALNWYRNLHRNWLDTAATPDHIGVPALMISAADDFFLPPTTTRGMERIVPDLERHTLSDCGHWTQQEQPEAVNALLLDWLARRMTPALSARSTPAGASR
ncbi:alpha/beta fold hydrolase [Variovorax ginsengisoli]|uniref:Pimeloyl-ACP methyl ester carboxylesterase n=1 Tax=Variovorax ginsengisoli TaxID=363844 RepID=A0ABT9S981_9BURK|nr:alpha/beta hydrolase [Variovorax ginsengisoli]MDP9900915.1 pimeloyl-ACP methyl ester carboxylesterase [Variovorax ginsengisoli]